MKKNKIPYSQICKPFEEARTFAQSLNLRDLKDWVDYCRSGEKPNDIPHKPDRIYKNKGWKSYGDWLGVWKISSDNKTSSISEKSKQYLSFEEAKKYVHSLRLRNVKEWFRYCDSGKRPKNIPYNPDRAYKTSGWKSYADWLGTVKIPKGFKYRPFEEAKKYVHLLSLSGSREWSDYCKSGEKPDDIPFAPYTIYADEGWVSMEDWLGLEDTKPKQKQKKKTKSFFDSHDKFAKFRK